MLLAFKVSPFACSNVKTIIQRYALLAGQEDNQAKSKMLCSPHCNPKIKASLTDTFGFKTMNKIGKYLGVDLDYDRKGRIIHEDLLNKI